MSGRLIPLVFLIILDASINTVAADARHESLKQQVLNDKTEASLDVSEYYKNNDYAYLWIKDKKLVPNAYGLFTYLSDANSQGLYANDFLLDDIRKRWGVDDLDVRAELELLLTRAFKKYARQLANGRWQANEVDEHWHIHPSVLEVKTLFSELKTSSIEEIINKIKPKHHGYSALLKQLIFYQKIALQGGWPIIADGPVLRKGVEHAQVKNIRMRLRMTKDLVSGATGQIDRVDMVFQNAVMYFQARHGLAIDGIVGPQTRAVMNVPIDQRIRQIMVNIDRWRWLPRELGKRYLLINLTGFELYAEEDGKTVLSMPIIIGKRYRETPSFSSKLRYLEINPYWTIPKRIVLEDLIPAQLRDPEYFKRKKIRILDGWKKKAKEIGVATVSLRKLNENYFPYTFRQDPGPLNSLGRVKFMFPNPFDVYLHDTPNRHLFDRRIRTYSSGCIRVKDPLRLSAYLLNAPTQQKEEEILQLIYRDENKGMSLIKAVPIYLLYWTAWTDQDGKLNFRDDIYGRDKLMLNQLKSNENR